MPFALRGREGADIGEQRGSDGSLRLRSGTSSPQHRRACRRDGGRSLKYESLSMRLSATGDASAISLPYRFEAVLFDQIGTLQTSIDAGLGSQSSSRG
jgi:hypothetical protein